eukprot:scpid62110/ scgid12786/ Ankyrin repeat, PH and SEC7 domain containing protein secG
MERAGYNVGLSTRGDQQMSDIGSFSGASVSHAGGTSGRSSAGTLTSASEWSAAGSETGTVGAKSENGSAATEWQSACSDADYQSDSSLTSRRRSSGTLTGSTAGSRTDSAASSAYGYDDGDNSRAQSDGRAEFTPRSSGFYATEPAVDMSRRHSQRRGLGIERDQGMSSYSTGVSSSASTTGGFNTGSCASSFCTDDSMQVGGGRRAGAGPGRSDMDLLDVGHCRSDLELVRAAECGDTGSVKTLLSSAQVSSVDIGVGVLARTPLHRASGYGQADVVEMLLAARAKVGARDRNNRTALHEACVGGYLTCLKLLLQADGTAHIDIADRQGLTAAHVAAMHGEAPCLETILDYGCDPCAEDASGRTAAHHAVLRDHGNTLKCLIERGIEVDCPDHIGQAPVHYAAMAGSVQCLKMLASSGVDMCSMDAKGIQPSHLAAASNHLYCLKFLRRDGGAEVDACDQRSRTVLHVAAEHDSLECVHWLLENGATASCIDGTGATPLHSAAFGGAARSFDCLRQHGANLDLKDARGDLPVHAAREGGCTAEIMKAIEGKISCHLCVRTREKKRFADLHPPTNMQTVVAELEGGICKPDFKFYGQSIASTSGIASRQSRHTPNDLSSLSASHVRLSKPGVPKTKTTRSSHRLPPIHVKQRQQQQQR